MVPSSSTITLRQTYSFVHSYHHYCFSYFTPYQSTSTSKYSIRCGITNSPYIEPNTQVYMVLTGDTYLTSTTYHIILSFQKFYTVHYKYTVQIKITIITKVSLLTDKSKTG